jgi:hypothetical protein
MNDELSPDVGRGVMDMTGMSSLVPRVPYETATTPDWKLLGSLRHTNEYRICRLSLYVLGKNL